MLALGTIHALMRQSTCKKTCVTPNHIPLRTSVHMGSQVPTFKPHIVIRILFIFIEARSWLFYVNRKHGTWPRVNSPLANAIDWYHNLDHSQSRPIFQFCFIQLIYILLLLNSTIGYGPKVSNSRPLHTWAKSHDHEIVRAQKKVFKGHIVWSYLRWVYIRSKSNDLGVPNTLWWARWSVAYDHTS